MPTRRHFLALGSIAVLWLSQGKTYAQNFLRIAAKRTPQDQWTSHPTQALDRLSGFALAATDTVTQPYGAWKSGRRHPATGHFYCKKINGRWWLIDPEGNPFIHKGIGALYTGVSARSREAYQKTFGNLSNWANQTTAMLREHGFNGAGGFSSPNQIKYAAEPLAYCLHIFPMQKFRDYLKAQGDFAGEAGWQGYPNDIVRVFDPRFDQFIESEAKKLQEHADDPRCLGYFTDNELPWKNDALDRILTRYNRADAGYQAAYNWLQKRQNGKVDTAKITDADRQAFLGYYFETYARKVGAVTRKYAPKKLYLGCRFNQHTEELASAEIFKAAGKHFDIISINHYHRWQPNQTQMQNWHTWSGKPFIISEFYVKGADTGMANQSGVGWIVQRQSERGYFYQNFVLELLKSKACVGWHWLGYQDNDPQNNQADPSNTDSNKGIVTWNYTPYANALHGMKVINTRIYRLIAHLDKKTG